MGVRTEVAKALYSKLNAAGIGAGVVDVPPQSEDGGSSVAFPYVAIGRVIYTERDTQTSVGKSFIARIHTYSRTGENSECLGIQDNIEASLHRSSLAVAGFNNFSLLMEDSDIISEVDGMIHGVCEYRGLIETA